MKSKSIIGSFFLFLLVVLFTSFVKVSKLDYLTSDRQQIHLNRPNKIEKNNFEDRKSIQNNIKIAFLIWSQKGEFEKQKDYDSRIQKQSKSRFTEICIEEIERKIKTINSSDLYINLLKYDAENEFFPAVIKFKESEWDINIDILIDEAQNFKEKELQNLEWQVEESEWCFINNDLFPSKIHLTSNKREMILKLPLPNKEDIVIAFIDLGIENLFLKDFIFNYSKTEKTKPQTKPSGNKPVKPINNANALDRFIKGTKQDGTTLTVKGSDDNSGDKSNGSFYVNSFYGDDSMNGKGWGLPGRKLVKNSKINHDCNESGKVVVKIWVNRQGNVIIAERTQGTTNTNPCLVNPALQTAKTFKWQPDANAPEVQIGFIVFNFQVGE